jgi:hypothetical protein
LFFLLVPAALFFAVSCGSDDEGGEETNVKTQCNSNIDCTRDSYCDLENPKQDENLGTLVYYCKKRQLCATQADCPISWKCKISEGFCITSKEASTVLCSADTDCQDPSYPKCNLATGECESRDGRTNDDETELPDSGHTDPDENDEDSLNDNDNEDPEKNDNDSPVSDNDTDSAENSLGKNIMTEDFEDGGSKWTRVPLTDGVHCWGIGIPTSGPGEAHGGANVAATELEGNYADNCKDLLHYNDPITIPSAGVPTISFYAWVNIVGNGYSPYDYVEVLVKKEDDLWDSLTGIYLSADTPSPLSALDNHRTKITKELGTAYYKFTGDLSAYKGKNVEIGFRFVSDLSDNKEGFYLDDISIDY